MANSSSVGGRLLVLLVLCSLTGCESFEDARRRALGMDDNEDEQKQSARAEKSSETPVPTQGEMEKKFGEHMLSEGAETEEYDDDGPLVSGDTMGFEELLPKDPAGGELTSETAMHNYGEAGMKLPADPGLKQPEAGDPLSTGDAPKGSYLSEDNKAILPADDPGTTNLGPTEEYLKRVDGGGQGGRKAKQSSGRRAAKPRPKKRRAEPTSRLRKSTAVPQVRLSEGITLPQVLPTGTAVGFAVRYQFTLLGPQSGAKYVWLIRSRTGKTMGRQVPLAGEGTLNSVVPEFRPQDAPFQCMILEYRADGTKRQIGKPFTFPTRIP